MTVLRGATLLHVEHVPPDAVTIIRALYSMGTVPAQTEVVHQRLVRQFVQQLHLHLIQQVPQKGAKIIARILARSSVVPKTM